MGEPRWYFGRRSVRRRAPNISVSVTRIRPSAGIENPDEHSPTTMASPSGASMLAARIASTPCSRRICWTWSAWRSSAAASLTVKPSRRQPAISSASWVNFPACCVTERVSSVSPAGPVAPSTSSSSRRCRLARREHVDDATAHAPLTDLDDGVGPLVTSLLQRLDQELAIEAVAGREAQRGLAELRRTGKRNVDRGRRGHDDERLAGEQATTDDGPLGVTLALAPAPPQARLALGKFH